MHQITRKWYYSTSWSADYMIKFDLEDKSANRCHDKAQKVFHVEF